MYEANETTSSSLPVRVLLVEDDPADALLIGSLLKESSPNLVVQRAGDGEEALRLVSALENPLPDLILLDLNLPRVSGHDVLRALKNDSRTSRILVIVLTTSDQEIDMIKTYGLRADGFITKPRDVLKFSNRISQLLNVEFPVAKRLVEKNAANEWSPVK